MGLYRYFPIPCERMGTLWTLMPIDGVAILEYGPGGTTHYSMEGYFMLGADMNGDLYTTHIDENDIALGGTERLENAIREIVEKHHPAFLFVMASTISAAIGTDLQAVCRQMQPQAGETVLVPVSGGGFRGEWTMGVEATLLMLVERAVTSPCAPEPTFNLIGSCADEHNFKADALEIARLMEGAFGLKLGVALTSPGASLERIAKMGGARINLTLRREGQKAADLLTERFGTPAVFGRPYGVAGTQAWLARVGEALGMVPNAAFLQSEMGMLQEPLRMLNMSARRRKATAMLGGHADSVAGLVAFLRGELGFQVNTAWCSAPGMASEEIPFFSETQWADAVQNFHGGVLLADGVALELLPPDSAGIQTAQPNLRQQFIFPYTPWMGFRGALYLAEGLSCALAEIAKA